MLVLSRLEGETIHIGPDIVITVVSIDRNKIRLGIDAPSSRRHRAPRPAEATVGEDTLFPSPHRGTTCR